MATSRLSPSPSLGERPVQQPGASKGPRKKRKIAKAESQGKPAIPKMGAMGVTSPSAMKGAF